MHIGGFQKLTLLDFPGQVACIVFTQGCNLRCPFCHNSTLISNVQQSKKEFLQDDIIKYLEHRSGLLDGVVISGGEPLIQPDLADFLRRIRLLGYLIKIDTNGTMPEVLEKLIHENLIDYVAMDIKSSPENYVKAAGTANSSQIEKISRSIEILRLGSIKFEFRTTVVKGIHTIRDIELVAKWICGEQPYYIQSYKDSGNILSPSFLSTFSDGELDNFREAASRYCPNTFIRK